MRTTVTETLLFLCSFVVIRPSIRAPLPNRDERSSVSERDTCCVEKCGTYERMNAGARKL